MDNPAVAQRMEHLATNQGAEGSNPSGGSVLEVLGAQLSATQRKRFNRQMRTDARPACGSYRWRQRHNKTVRGEKTNPRLKSPEGVYSSSEPRR